MSQTAAIIVAAGRGTRAGGGLPKQWRPLCGRRVIDWTYAAFAEAPQIDQIVLVLHRDDLALGEAFAGALCVAGGPTRAASVHAGLLALSEADISKVLIHDAARPLVSQAIIAGIVATLDYAQGAAPALEITDALWRGSAGQVAGTQDRAGLFRAQTPQGFSYDAILAAHADHPDTAADDVEVARNAGIDVVMIPGEDANMKVTFAADFARAERMLQDKMEVRFGNGFDVHAFTEGDHVILCGVKVPHDRALKGHSDADVGMHAVTDALYGALAQGDIGRHFPPSDPQWKGADSAVFLRHAVNLVATAGLQISNIDLTLICEHPKISPHAEAMQARMAELMALPLERVSIKATTSERLGFTGRGEGIAAIATAALTSE